MTGEKATAAWRADFALLGNTLIWGATFVLVKTALQDISSLLFIAIRFFIAAGALALAFRFRPAILFSQPGALRGGIIVGAFLFAGYFFQTAGLRYTTASKSAFITGLSIPLVPILGAIVYRRWPRVRDVAGIVVATGGMALLTLQDERIAFNRGDVLTMFCAAAFAGHIVSLGHFSKTLGFESLSVLQVATAAILAGGSFWWVEDWFVEWRPAVVIALGVTGLLATAVAFTVQAWAQQHTTATRTALIFSMEPVFAALTAFAVLGEMLPQQGIFGAILILGGVLLVELKPAEHRAHQSVRDLLGKV
ncbi:MAG: DMT family transporter [Bryobacteraceae bacterium]